MAGRIYSQRPLSGRLFYGHEDDDTIIFNCKMQLLTK
jgi:hypothetical protein